MGGGWVIFAIFIGIAIISAISHVLKNQQQAEAPPSRRRNQRPPRSVESEDDSFLAEIERLRKKAAASPPKAVPVVKPKQQPKKARPAPSLRVEELPAATIVTTPAKTSSLSSPILTPASTVATIVEIAKIADVAKPQAAGGRTAAKMTTSGKTVGAGRGEPATAFAKNLMGLLSTKGSLPMAVVLQEVLGPPKSRR